MSPGHIPAALRRLVHERADGRCEYCLIPELTTLVAHEVDHVIAQKHGGATQPENLALSCAVCNKYKGSDLASIDPESGRLEPLFHPRLHRWREHFELDGAILRPRTAIGRVTVRLLQINHSYRIVEREVLVAAGLLVPPA